jgi:hypothetical protein
MNLQAPFMDCHFSTAPKGEEAKKRGAETIGSSPSRWSTLSNHGNFAVAAAIKKLLLC